MTTRDYVIAVVLFAVNLLFVPVLFYGIGVGYLPWQNALIAFVLWSWLMLPGTTWRDYDAGMTINRVKHMNDPTYAQLPPLGQRALEPDHERLITWQLALPASVRNFVFNATWGWLYFGDAPREVGLTKRLNRYRSGSAGPRLQATGERVAVRWLDRFDARGRHT